MASSCNFNELAHAKETWLRHDHREVRLWNARIQSSQEVLEELCLFVGELRPVAEGQLEAGVIIGKLAEKRQSATVSQSAEILNGLATVEDLLKETEKRGGQPEAGLRDAWLCRRVEHLQLCAREAFGLLVFHARHRRLQKEDETQLRSGMGSLLSYFAPAGGLEAPP